MWTGTLIAAFVRMAEIAAPVIKAFHADFYLHDAKVIAGMKPGDVVLWKPRESGSCLIVIARNVNANESAQESWDAYSSVHGADGWYQIESYSSIAESWSVVESKDPARTIAIYAEATASRNAGIIRGGGVPPVVKELHM